MMSKSREERLLTLLQKLQAKENNDPDAIAEFESRSWNLSTDIWLNDQEHKDIVFLFNQGLIESKHYMVNPSNVYSQIGIYDYRLTDDGRAYLAQNEQAAEDSSPTNPNPKIFIIHGTDRNGIVPHVQEFCKLLGATPIRMMEEPNNSQTLPEKLARTMSEADYFIAVLTADENVGRNQRSRPNAYGELMSVVINQRSRLLAILVEEGVDIPTNLQGLAYISLSGNWSMDLTKEFKAKGILK